jgi:hypothetical protein
MCEVLGSISSTGIKNNKQIRIWVAEKVKLLLVEKGSEIEGNLRKCK